MSRPSFQHTVASQHRWSQFQQHLHNPWYACICNACICTSNQILYVPYCFSTTVTYRSTATTHCMSRPSVIPNKQCYIIVVPIAPPSKHIFIVLYTWNSFHITPYVTASPYPLSHPPTTYIFIIQERYYNQLGIREWNEQIIAQRNNCGQSR